MEKPDKTMPELFEKVDAFSKMTKEEKVHTVGVECSKLLIAVMLDAGLENYINMELKDNFDNSYQLIFVKKPASKLETK